MTKQNAYIISDDIFMDALNLICKNFSEIPYTLVGGGAVQVYVASAAIKQGAFSSVKKIQGLPFILAFLTTKNTKDSHKVHKVLVIFAPSSCPLWLNPVIFLTTKNTKDSHKVHKVLVIFAPSSCPLWLNIVTFFNHKEHKEFPQSSQSLSDLCAFFVSFVVKPKSVDKADKYDILMELMS